MKLFAENTIIAAMGLSLAGIAGAYEVNQDKSIAWKYHDCQMDATTGSDGDNGAAYFDKLQDGRIPVSGTAVPCYARNFDTSQKLLTAPTTLDALNSKIAYTLQERRHINNSNIVLSNDDQTNIYVAAGKNVDVWATFMNEGAGFENSVGFFTWQGKDTSGPQGNKPTRRTDGVPTLADGTTVLTSERIMFPRASTTFPLPRSNTTGTTVYLGKFNGGTNGLGIGFMVAANGWKGDARGTAKGGVSPTRDKSWIYYSVKDMNPECVGKTSAQCGNLNQHTILLNDTEVTGTDNVKYQRLILGIEDFKRTEASCDHDFNDVLMAIHIKPETGAITNLTDLPKLASSTEADTDGDGVKDSLDEFPTDATRTYSRYYPGKSSWGTLAYEDLWPNKGDYDFNDLLVRYRSREILNASRAVVALEMDLRLDAVGAGYRNGFAINLPNVSKSNVKSALLNGTRRNIFSEAPIALKATDEVNVNTDATTGTTLLQTVTGGDTGAVFEIFRDAKKLIHPDNGAAGGTNSLYNTQSCTGDVVGFRNTGKSCAAAPAAEFKLKVEFNTAVASTSFPLPPYDPFLFRDKADPSSKMGNNIEVHLPGKLPTSRADTTVFGTGIDRSVTTTRNTYLSNSKLPWALDIPAEWDYAHEKLDVTSPYPNVVPWAQSGGKTNTNWFSAPANNGSGTFKANAITVNN